MYNFAIIVLLFAFSANGQDVPEVDAGGLGIVLGTYATTMGSRERTYQQFLGIKYGKEPSRFMPSELFEGPLSEDGVFNATEYGSRCPQPDERETYSEDCLFLNIFAPTSGSNHPVLVFIPGAGFTSGGGDWMRGERLLNKDIVLVMLNHRLGFYGSCNLEIPEAPGNAMLYDTLTALQWIQSFIHYFGGSPNLVTIAGQSSGGAMSSHVLVSPKFTGLVHRVIAVSGSTLDPSTFSGDHVAAALNVAQYAGCYDEDLSSLPNKTQVALCLKALPHVNLSRAQEQYYLDEMKDGTSIGFEAISPSLQTFLGEDALIPIRPETALEKGLQNNIPLMMMVTRDDGSFGLTRFHDENLVPNGLVNDTKFMRSKMVQSVFNAIGIPDPGQTVSGAFSKMYMVEEARLAGNFSHMVPSLFDLMSVIFFKAGALRTIQLHSELNADTYYFSFEYEGRYKRHPFYENFLGEVGHADDQIYLFRLSGEFNEEEQRLSDIMVDYYTNFMYTGNPNTYPPGQEQADLPFFPKFEMATEKYLIFDENIREASKYEDSWVIANRKKRKK